MYVRWKREETKRRGTVLRAELVETFRDEVTREPRSRYLAYLGSIREDQVNDRYAQLQFWKRLDRKLTSLLMPVSQEMRVKLKVSQHVPKPAGYPAMRSLFREAYLSPALEAASPESKAAAREADDVSPTMAELVREFTALLKRLR